MKKEHPAVAAALKANSKLKSEGGAGQAGVGMVGGSILTLKETAALAIARDVIDDAERAENKKVTEIPLATLARYAEGRTARRPCNDAQVLQEVCRLQNHAKYGDLVSRG